MSSHLIVLSPVDIIIIGPISSRVADRLLSEGAHQHRRGFFPGRPRDDGVDRGAEFLSANLGSLELMGWAAASYQYGILATHWYWIGAIPGHAVSRPGDDAVLLHLAKPTRCRGICKLRFGESSRALSAVSFAFMTVLMSGINMYRHGAGDEGRARAGTSTSASGFRRSRWRFMSLWAVCVRPSSTKCCSSS